MLLRTKVFPADRFDWSAKDKNPSCFASDLAAFRDGYFGELYDDAADLGFVLVNPRTGGESWWYLEHVHLDGEDDVTHYTLKATPESVRKHPHLATYTLTVWND